MERYARLITHVAGRYLFDADDVAAVQTEVFESIYHGKLAAYQGRSSLAAWVAVVTRNITADFLRRRFGRRETPVGLKRLSRLHREIFRLYYIEGTTFFATLETLRKKNASLDEDTLLDHLQEIHDRITDKTLRRIAYDLAAQSVGAASGRLLEFCQNTTWDHEASGADTDPLTVLTLQEAEIRARKILDLVAELPPEDRLLLALRFDEGLRAREIADKLGYSGQRKVFSTLDRIFLKIRRRSAKIFEEDE
jgi:RNA polymerase sigma factor (sigma-70 family)